MLESNDVRASQEDSHPEKMPFWRQASTVNVFPACQILIGQFLVQ